jgi:hypothetical protein
VQLAFRDRVRRKRSRSRLALASSRLTTRQARHADASPTTRSGRLGPVRADLETINRQLVAERDARTIEADAAKRRVTELEDELSAARESLRRVIKAKNRTP